MKKLWRLAALLFYSCFFSLSAAIEAFPDDAKDARNTVQLAFSELASENFMLFAAVKHHDKTVCRAKIMSISELNGKKFAAITIKSPWIKGVVIQPGCRTVRFSSELGADGQMSAVPTISCRSLPSVRFKLRFRDKSGKTITDESYRVFLNPARQMHSLNDRCDSGFFVNLQLASGKTDENGLSMIEIPDYRYDEFLHDIQLAVVDTSDDPAIDRTRYYPAGNGWPEKPDEPVDVTVIRMSRLSWSIAADWRNKTTLWKRKCRKRDCCFVVSKKPGTNLLPDENYTNYILDKGSEGLSIYPGTYDIYIAEREEKRFCYFNDEDKIKITEVLLPEDSALKLIAHSDGKFVVNVESRDESDPPLKPDAPTVIP